MNRKAEERGCPHPRDTQLRKLAGEGIRAPESAGLWVGLLFTSVQRATNFPAIPNLSGCGRLSGNAAWADHEITDIRIYVGNIGGLFRLLPESLRQS